MSRQGTMKDLAIRAAYGAGAIGLADRIFPRTSTAIICLHEIEGGRLRALLLQIMRKNSIVPLERIVAWLAGRADLPRRPVALTFDDGYESNYSEAYPVLRELGVPATIFLSTGFIGGTRAFWWDELRDAVAAARPASLEAFGRSWDLSSPEARSRAAESLEGILKRLDEDEKSRELAALIEALGQRRSTAKPPKTAMTWDQVREMAAGGITFGAHTVDHVILTRVSAEREREEIERSRDAIIQQTGKAPAGFAYPNGKQEDFDADTIKAVREAGYPCALTFIDGLNDERSDPYCLRRIDCGLDPATIEYKLSDLPYRLKRLRRASC